MEYMEKYHDITGQITKSPHMLVLSEEDAIRIFDCIGIPKGDVYDLGEFANQRNRFAHTKMREEVMRWIREDTGQKHFRIMHMWHAVSFSNVEGLEMTLQCRLYFTSKADAVLFKLRWAA